MKCFRHDPGKVCPDCGLDRTHVIRFTERTLASVRCECYCGWKAEVLTSVPNRQIELNKLVEEHVSETQSPSSAPSTR